MPSKTVALALVAMVLLSGCSMFDGGSDAPETDVGEAPDHHEFVFGSDTGGNAFEATVTVSKDGEELLSESLSSDGNGLYANLSAVTESGPYTVTVNTTLPAVGGGNMSKRVTVDGALGNATAVNVGYQGIRVETFPLPRRDVTNSVGYRKSGQDAETTLRIWYRGEQVVDTTFTAEYKQNLQTITDVNQTGVYRVGVRSEGEWTNKTVVLTDPDEQIKIRLGYNTNQIRVEIPFDDREA